MEGFSGFLEYMFICFVLPGIALTLIGVGINAFFKDIITEIKK